MKKLLCIILIWFLISSFAYCFSIPPVRAGGITWLVDDDGPADFSTIQAAINAASENDTIHVKEGTYNENIEIRTALTLEGEARNSILNGNIYAQNSWLGNYTIQNFTILSGINLDCKIAPVYVYDNTVYGGLYLGGYPADTSVEVVNNTINGEGISMGENLRAYICGNTFVSCPQAISCYTSSVNARDNKIIDSDRAFNIDSASSVIIDGNDVEDCGTFLYVTNNGYSEDLEVYQNTVKNCLFGFYFDDPYISGVPISADVYNNNFFGLNQVSYFSSPTNIDWYAGYIIGGNYWSDYYGVDNNGDGFGDSPYIINSNNKDNYPLMGSWSQVSFADSFETGNLIRWDGSRHSTGEAVGVSSYQSCIGAYSGRVTTNGGGVEYSYVYKKMSASAISVFGTFYVSESGIVENGDRIYLISFQASSNTLATVGWRKVDGVVKWFLLTRNGVNYAISYSDESPILGKYYSVKLYWTKDALTGEATAEINLLGDYDIEKLSLSGNTAAYGDITEVRVGLPTVSYCGRAAVYFDCITIADQDQYNYEPYLYPIGYSRTVFSDGYESGNFETWSQVNNYNGGSARVVSNTFSGSYCARFTTGSSNSRSGQAYCSKNINLPLQGGSSRLNMFTSDYNLASLNLPWSRGRITLFRAWSGNVEVIAAGIDKTDGVMRWFVTRKDGLVSSTVYSNLAPEFNEWFQLRIEWNPFQYGWSELGDDCGCFMHLYYADGSHFTIDACADNPLVYPTITRVDVGLVRTANCRVATVYVDDFDANTMEWE